MVGVVRKARFLWSRLGEGEVLTRRLGDDRIEVKGEQIVAD